MNSRELEVNEVLKLLRPAMEADGGGVDLVSIVDDIIWVKFKGACLICPSINLTMKYGLLVTLKEKLPWVKDVKRQE